ncbi:MAG TPA: hypothetical protein VIK53_10655 [Verrucomicrobiae bacterium]
MADTRRMLREQGFKTDLADFNLSTDAASRAREGALTAFKMPLQFEPSGNSLDFMPVTADNAVIVIWKQDWLKTELNTVHWPDLREALDGNRWMLDDACNAALSGPIRFNLDATKGSAMVLRHLAMLRNLSLALGSREILELHDRNTDTAWTNLLAVTRLVTAWEPEPAEISHLVRFSLATIAFNDAWQALQFDGWPDEKLAELQHEWESVNFFANLPETAAFRRASVVAICEQEREEPLSGGISFPDLLKAAIHSPTEAYSDIKLGFNQARYRSYGTFVDERDLLFFFQARELEIRQAIQSPTWARMEQLPGVTNHVFFHSKYRSRLQSMMNLQELNIAVQKRSFSLLGVAAETEARSRILITAIALERYRGRHGEYPATLDALTPEFLKSVPVDFMDGQPLRYQLMDEGHFVLYSIGLDCVDDGGLIQTPEQRSRNEQEGLPFGMRHEADIVWPRPATIAEAASVRDTELDARAQKGDDEEEQSAGEQWSSSDQRQATVETILTTSVVAVTNEPDYDSRPLVEILRNPNTTGTNELTLQEMLTLKQIITGAEPEAVTFEIPAAYNVLTGICTPHLYVDSGLPLAVPGGSQDLNFDAGQLECQRATNGDTLLVWNTIYESPGKHVLRLGFEMEPMTSASPAIPPAPPTLPSAVYSGPLLTFVVSNLCQFSLGSAHFDPDIGATFHARLPEPNGSYVIELNTTNGERLKTITGSTTNGIIKVDWNLVDDHGQRFVGDFFNSVFHLTFPDSGRVQTLRGP